MDEFIHIRSELFPVLPGEPDELINEGMYGKALGEYLSKALTGAGYDCSEPFCEDWGWALGAASQGVSTMVCIYSDPTEERPTNYVCTASGPRREWSWRRFRHLNTVPPDDWYVAFQKCLLSLLEVDPEIEVVAVAGEFPLG